MDPSGHKSIMSIYYAYSGGSGSFKVQANNSPYYYNSKAKIKGVKKTQDFKKAWNNINASQIKTLVLYLHGGEGVLYFRNGSIRVGEIKKLKKKKIKTIYLISCKGARGKKSVAKALYERTGKKAKVYASKESVSFRIENRKDASRPIVYIPRYDKDYCDKYGKRYYFQNPVKRW